MQTIMKYKRTNSSALHFLILALFLPSSSLPGEIVFDSFTPPSTDGGGSSANAGVAIQLSVSSDLTITGISILNQMLAPGNLRFAILSYRQPDFLLLTDPIAFTIDAPGIPTWKDSGAIMFTLNAGNQYLVGYVTDVEVNEVGDHVAESGGGVTSDLYLHCINGFQSPTYSHACISGTDIGVRLEVIPEPSPLTLLFCGGTAWFFWMLSRKKKNA